MTVTREEAIAAARDFVIRLGRPVVLDFGAARRVISAGRCLAYSLAHDDASALRTPQTLGTSRILCTIVH